MDHLVVQLQQLGVDDQSARDVSTVATTVKEALQLLGRDENGRVPESAAFWREFYSVKWQRLYYCNDRIAYNSWDAPPCFQFREWQLDASLNRIPLPLARALYLALDKLLLAASSGPSPDPAYQALGVLCKLVGNVVDCGNSQEKFRTVRLSNPKVQAAWQVPGVQVVLSLVGFQRQGDTMLLPADAPLGPLQAAASRARMLEARRGHSGSAKAVHESEGGKERPPSEFYNKPGFIYQEQIWHCSVCNHPINDGSERLWTGNVDAPQGEYRYRCTTCAEGGSTFDLCQQCWDIFQQQLQQQGSSHHQQQQRQQQGGTSQAQQQGPLHPLSHVFRHIGPRVSKHQNYYATFEEPGGSDGWPRGPAAGGYSRGLQRLQERYGIQFA